MRSDLMSARLCSPDKRTAIPESDLALLPAAWRSLLASVTIAANDEAADAIAARLLQ